MTEIVRITVDDVIALVEANYGIKNAKFMIRGEYDTWVEDYSHIQGVEGVRA